MKRILIATSLGVVAGAICAAGAFYGRILTFTPVVLLWILLNRALMGFAIGASALRVHWAWNGIVLGLLVGSLFSYYLFMTLGPGPMPLINFFANGLFGLLIELFTTLVFKQPALVSQRPPQGATAA
jgi:hypothetical protein